MKLRIRKARGEDARGLDRVLLVISDAPADPAQSARLIEQIYRDPKKALLVAEDQETGVICGTLFGLVFEDVSSSCRPILLVENVAVLPEYRRMGVGRALFSEIENWAAGYHYRYEMLVSGPQRTEAHAFYRALGFEEKKGFKKYPQE